MKTGSVFFARAAAVTLLLSGCTPTNRVTIERMAPPEANVSGIRRVAILSFTAPPREKPYAKAARARLNGILESTGRYRVMPPGRVDEALKGRGIRFTYPPAAATVRKIGAALGMDAVICGELENYTYEEENCLVKVREKVWTGDYLRDEQGFPVSDRDENGKDAPRKTYEQRMVEKNCLKRAATLQLHYRMNDASRGNAIWADSETESGSWEGTGAREIARMPGKEVIFDLLLDRATKEFVKRIAPHPIKEERVLERGIFHITNLGVELAKNDLWDEAVEKWLQATKSVPDDAAAYYNLGIAFERHGLFDLSYKAYQNALTRRPKSKRYIEAIAHIQKLMKDLQ